LSFSERVRIKGVFLHDRNMQGKIRGRNEAGFEVRNYPPGRYWGGQYTLMTYLVEPGLDEEIIVRTGAFV